MSRRTRQAIIWGGLAAFTVIVAGQRLTALFADYHWFASLGFSDRASQIVQVEYVHDSARDAKRCAEKRGGDILVLKRRVEDALTDLFDRTTALAIIDPPRDGCPESVVEQVCRALRPQRAILVGRAVDVLARSLKRFAKGGLQAKTLVPIDTDPLAREPVVVAELTR